MIISSLSDLNKIDAKIQAAKISSTVGKRKRMEILKKASEMKIKVLNPGVEAEKNE
jgi:large subunit ribosomal protein L32e